MGTILIYLVVFIILLCVWKYYSKSSNVKRLPPCPPGKPLLGNLLNLKESPHLKFDEWVKLYGPIFTWTVFNTRGVTVNRADLVRKLLTHESLAPYTNDRFSTFQGEYIAWNYKDVLFGRGGDIHGRLRKAMHKGLRLYGDGVSTFENTVLLELKRVVKLIKGKDGKDFDPRPIISDSIGNLISILLSGDQIESSEESKRIWKLSDQILLSLRPVFMSIMEAVPFLRYFPGPIRNTVHDVLTARDEVISKYYTIARETYEPGKTRGYVDALIKLQEEDLDENGVCWLKDEHIKGLIVDMVFGGLMTTTNAILIAILVLINHPACLEKLKKEILDTIGPDRLPSLKDREDMPYIQAVILETLRYSAHVSVPPPHRCTADIEFEGYTIPQDSIILLNLWSIHHDPEIWSDPWQFRPERFLDDHGDLLPPEHNLRQSLILFGVGRRSCVGETMARSRMFLYLATLIQHFDLGLPKDHDIVSHDPHGYSDTVILQPPQYFVTAVPQI
ncbi:hypothetical protein CHS0354_014366 [Potamilus streckersoni]|uniref:Cytochrome P450 n=1 Tax=Potamilus streckersoni TaxID=2493646 RepID=A0AAE0VYN1_9BIVA|nr:hypothetical protein CHS0354_014366 [Potamilus streckersoni]